MPMIAPPVILFRGPYPGFSSLIANHDQPPAANKPKATQAAAKATPSATASGTAAPITGAATTAPAGAAAAGSVAVKTLAAASTK